MKKEQENLLQKNIMIPVFADTELGFCCVPRYSQVSISYHQGRGYEPIEIVS